MNKAVIIVMLFCVSSFTGCIGGNESSGLEVLDQDEQIEPVGENDLSNISKELDELEAEVNTFLEEFNQFKVSQASLEANDESMITLMEQLEEKISILEIDIQNFDVTRLEDRDDALQNSVDATSQIVSLLESQLSSLQQDFEVIENILNDLTIMSLMDDTERAVFTKMKLLQDLRDNGAVNRDLAQTDLSGSDLSDINFAGADLSGANLDGARFVGNNFSGANLDGSHANGAYFRNAEFEDASVVGAHWNEVEIVGSDMSSSIFTETEMHDCIILNSDLSFSNFEKVNANDCQFTHVYGESSVWKGSSLDHSEFEISAFDNADFSKHGESTSTRLVGVTYAAVSFVGATFAYADMSYSTMEVSPLAIASDSPIMQAAGVRAVMCIQEDPDHNWCEEWDYSLDTEFKDESEMNDNDQFDIIYHSRALNCVDFMNADLNNTKLDNSDICIVPIPEVSVFGSMESEILMANQIPVNARFENAQFRRADLTNVQFGGSPTGVFTANPYGNASSGCIGFASCLNFRNTAFSLADLSDSYFDYVDLTNSDFAGSSVGRVVWGHALWMDSTWTDSSTISGRGDPNNWDSD